MDTDEESNTPATRVKIGVEVKVAALEERVRELEDMVESSDGLLRQLVRWVTSQGEALVSNVRDVEEISEFLGMIPQRIQLFDGIVSKNVHCRRYPEPVDKTPSPSGSPPPQGQDIETPNLASTSASASEAATAPAFHSALAPTLPSGSAPPHDRAPSPLPVGNVDIPLNAPPLVGPEMERERTGHGATASAPATDISPGVLLIPPTPQNSQEAATYGVVSLVPTANNGGNERLADADVVAGAVVMPDPNLADKNAVAEVVVGAGNDVSSGADQLPHRTTDLQPTGAEETGQPPSADLAFADRLRDADRTLEAPPIVGSEVQSGPQIDLAAELRTPRQPSPGCSTPVPRSRSRLSPIPPQHLRRSPRLSPSPEPPAKRKLPGDVELGGSGKRAKRS
jgi:hypothetical protein